jgi:hypothetical protein
MLTALYEVVHCIVLFVAVCIVNIRKIIKCDRNLVERCVNGY